MSQVLKTTGLDKYVGHCFLKHLRRIINTYLQVDSTSTCNVKMIAVLFFCKMKFKGFTFRLFTINDTFFYGTVS